MLLKKIYQSMQVARKLIKVPTYVDDEKINIPVKSFCWHNSSLIPIIRRRIAEDCAIETAISQKGNTSKANNILTFEMHFSFSTIIYFIGF